MTADPVSQTTPAEAPADDSGGQVETVAIRHLTEAVDSLRLAREATALGFVADHIDAALAQIRKAVMEACNG